MRRVKCIKRADYEPSPAFCHGWMSELSSFFAANSLITMSGFSDQSCRLAGHLVHPMFVLFFIADSLLMTDSFFHIDPADNIGLDRHWFAFFIQLLSHCLRQIALQTILQRIPGVFDSSKMSPSTITYDLNVASMA